MKPLTKPGAMARADKIKKLMLSKADFGAELARLYQTLLQQGRHGWIIEIYNHLSLYASKDQQAALCRPELMQAFLFEGDLKKARLCAKKLSTVDPDNPETHKLLRGLKVREESTLPPYTPLAAVSQYAAAAPKPRKTTAGLPAVWLQALQELTPEKLQETGYFEKQKQLSRAPRPWRSRLQTLFDELTLNYLFQNRQAVAVLSGSMLELLLAIHLHNTMKTSKVSVNGVCQPIFELNLSKLLEVCAQQYLLSSQLLRLSRAARLQRNFIHPGKEMAEKNTLTPAGARLCFLAVLELTDVLFGSNQISK